MVYSRCYATIVVWAVISDPFLGSGLINSFPRQRLRMQWRKCDVFYTVHAEELKRTEVEQPVQLNSAREAVPEVTVDKNSWRAALTRRHECVQLKNPYVDAKERLMKTHQAGKKKNLAGAVVVCKLWKSAIAL